jgi:hypothetical protein
MLESVNRICQIEFQFFSRDKVFRLTWQAAYAIARGVTFLIPIMEATQVFTLD